MDLIIILGLVVLGVAVWYIVDRANRSDQQPDAQVEINLPIASQPAQPVACGCGRSSTGYCQGYHALAQDEWDVHPDNPRPKKVRKSRAKKSASKE